MKKGEGDDLGRRKKSKEELEELTRTQVLNLQELEKAAKDEKRTNRKPAAIFAILGVFSISLGLCYPSINNMLSSRDVPETPTVSEQRQEETEETTTTEANPTTMTCTLTQNNDVELTSTTTTYTFQFLDTGTLRYYEKVEDIKATTEVISTPASIVSLDTSLSNLMQTQINGYLLEKTPTASTTPNVVDGYNAKMAVDLTMFDPTTLTDLHRTNTLANVEFTSADTKDTIQQALLANGYTCQ